MKSASPKPSNSGMEQGFEPNATEIALAKAVARRLAHNFYTVDRDDIEQQLMLWLMANGKYVLRYRAEWDSNGGKAKLGTALGREGQSYALRELREQDRRSNASDADDSYYDEDMVRRTLPYIWEDVCAAPARVEHLDSELRDRALAVLMDVTAAFYRLPARDQTLVAAHYRDGLTYEEVGAEHGLSADACRKRVDRALGRMMVHLSGSPAWHAPVLRKRGTGRGGEAA